MSTSGTTVAGVQKMLDDMKSSTWKLVSVVVIVLIFAGGSVQSCTVMYMTRTDRKVEKLEDRCNSVSAETIKNNSDIRGLEKDAQGLGERIIRMDERFASALGRIERKLDNLSNE